MFLSLTNIVELIALYRYTILFPISIFEGPIVTVIAGFLVSIGEMNLWLVFPIVILGDLTGDALFYALGRYGGMKFVNRYGKYFGINAQNILLVEHHFDAYLTRTILLGKFAHSFGFVVLTTAGILKARFGKFMLVNFLGIVPKTIIFLLIGYYFGAAYNSIGKYLDFFAYGTLIIVVVLGLSYWLVRKIAVNYFSS